ncbi:hypothetical protein FRC14_001894 [Serendipita sp. 396]|nr:hypothetical protein FRC14_001894 [Serendipita sp. 396]KAG8786014.1 hypothetical protein FRC15_000286 [Serendipita sp. 397]KAG8823965.1 hypothetical protein FRC19_002797 [Serendipita sp. 401]KAG8860065.1 hypothetical protein FRB91_004849 [Serendipita sp. 411]KAG8869284.1 hypothetical protein FRC20_001774 [Serendipita sp. 405]
MSLERQERRPSLVTTDKPTPTDMLSGLLLEDAMIHNASHKMHNPVDKMAFLGFLAGIWVGFGGIAATSVAGGIPAAIRAEWPVLPKLGTAFFFPFALHFIILFGGELFTGNTMILSIGIWNRAIPFRRALLNLLIVYTFNFLGCLVMSYIFSYQTELFHAEPWRSFTQEIAISKTKAHPWWVIFLKAIPANALVCMAVMLGFASRDSAGKILALWFPVVMFVLPGFEHAIANMYFVSNGLFHGADITVGWMFYNQSAAVLGNAIGGAIVIGTVEHAMNHWVSPLPWESGHPVGTLAAHDVESSRKANEFRPVEEKERMKELTRTRSMNRTMTRQRTKSANLTNSPIALRANGSVA